MTAIEVSGIAKQYRLGDTPQGVYRYKSLRDVIASIPSRIFGRARTEENVFWALNDVSFRIEQGDIVGLIGRNGAGKSTMLKVLSRVTDPTRGRIRVLGRIGSLLEVGTGFHPELSVRDNIFLNGAILGMHRHEIQRRFDEIVAFAEVEKFIDTSVKHYSSGMYLRLAFAVAAHLEPEILLVDEVLAVGDAAFQKKCLGKMGDVSKQGRTIVFVSHNMTALRSLCTRAIWLHRGRLVEDGNAGEIIDRYLQRNTTSLLEKTWEDDATAPGDERVRLKSVRVIPQSGGDMTTQTTIDIEFSYTNMVADETLNVSMFLHTLEEVCVFNTYSTPGPRPTGSICETVRIPANLLNTGSYYVSVLLVKDGSRPLFRVNNVAAFEVGEGERTGAWFGRFPGVVHPKLSWTLQVPAASASSRAD